MPAKVNIQISSKTRFNLMKFNVLIIPTHDVRKCDAKKRYDIRVNDAKERCLPTHLFLTQFVPFIFHT